VADLQLGVAQGGLGFGFAAAAGDPPVAGAIAGWASPAAGITVMAAMSVVVTLALAPGLRPAARTGTGRLGAEHR
jgi:hypothetical protein